jgi:1-acyl-sn-glycerol-3-phosphate acyltransferase
MFRNPFTRGVVRAAGYISNGSTDEMIHGATAALRTGDSLVMFPEGTRTRPGQPMQFARGTASIAVKAADVLTPVYIRCEPLLLPKFAPWYRVPPRRPHYTLEVGEDIDLASYHGLPPPKASRLLNAWLLRHFTERLGISGGYNATSGN